ncbi:MAG: lipoyl(octanoyl) transferase [Omnitrophica WOR_2 bacterium RIFCSPHIGHO2_02_FULL_50_17]|nr:MAG: lipoyl(octanoyl) transferase [Omnitrophica WOR_2 bacterium RIFCSPHIGHO2_02_FULL_50_17]
MLGALVNNYHVQDLSLIDYAATYRIQKECVERVIAGGAQTLLLCEHLPVITLGRLAKEANVLSREAIASKGIRIISVDRGGDVTLHSPGQLVVYPILRLENFKKDLRWYLHQLEQVAIDLLMTFGIVADRIPGKTGVWVDGEKIASIGIGVKKWVAFHGLAINVCTDLEVFDLIKPCGLDIRMTSMTRLKGEPVDMGGVKERLVECFSRGFGLKSEIRV